jgi:UDP-glucose 4-epimerase
MRILITGAAGFLGTALANQLVREGHTVRGLDDLSTCDQGGLLPEVHFTRGDVSDRPKLWTMLQEVDCVYHLAARVLVPESLLYPREYNQVNVGGTVSLMEAIRDVGVKRVIFASSGAIYGNQERQPVSEAALPNPRSPYAVSKLSAEYYVRTIGRLWNIETVCLRVSTPIVRTASAAGTLRCCRPFCASVQNATLGVQGDGVQTRD